MGFWIFMFICDLLIPITMLGFGYGFEKKAPDRINGVYGYRTTRSMINMDTWRFAHNYCGRLWKKIGWVLLVISIIVSLATIPLDEDGIGKVGGALCMVQSFFLIGSIFPTERALKKTFDKRGRRINKE